MERIPSSSSTRAVTPLSADAKVAPEATPAVTEGVSKSVSLYEPMVNEGCQLQYQLQTESRDVFNCTAGDLVDSSKTESSSSAKAMRA